MLSWSDAAQAQLAGGAVRAGVFVRVATAPTLIRVWGGVGEFAMAADLVEDADGALYLGFGELGGLPAINQLINGLAERVDFRLAGVAITPEIARLASSEAAVIVDAEVNLGFLVLGPDLQPVSPMAWVWNGVADNLTVERQDAGSGQVIRSISLSVGTAMTGRRRPKPEYWTDSFQRERSPDDGFCGFVAAYNQGTTKVWPN
jgi:hypothetical protein